LRPKPVQYNDGRIEVSVRWPVAVGVGLLLFVVLLVVYRLGHLGGRAEFAAPLDSESARPVPQQSAAADRAAQTGVSGETGNDAAASQTAGSTGDHVIVLAHHATRTQLVPVQEHFRRHGVGTAIIAFERLRQYFGDRGLSTGAAPGGDGFMLITDRGYENPVKPGTDGYAVRQKIKEIGAQYEAPEGYESFAPNRFADAYGMKLQ
jgi:GNAT superfamily N-acetyltransferase